MTIIPLVNKLRDFVKESKNLNEENTKLFCVLPLFVYLGYDVFSAEEVAYEYGACLRHDRTERCDLAVLDNDKNVHMLVEIKSLGKDLSLYTGQIKQYFVAESSAKYAILTNGDEYWFYEDFQKTTIKEAEPVRKIKISEIKDADVLYLNAFIRSVLLPISIEIKDHEKKEVVVQSEKELQDKNSVCDFYQANPLLQVRNMSTGEVYEMYKTFCKEHKLDVLQKGEFSKKIKKYYGVFVVSKRRGQEVVRFFV